MKRFCQEDDVEWAAYLIKQQCVYLEKSIREKRETGQKCYLAFLWRTEWRTQLKQFNGARNCEIDALRPELEARFAPWGRLECRFMDLNVLSLLFSDCEAADVRAFCASLRGDYALRDCGELPADGPVAIEVFNALLSVPDEDARRVELCVGLSYQQNYLADVVARDRGEARKLLLIEAVDQALLTHHCLIDGEHGDE